jgi:uncharacterized protein (TIGR02300 family)
LAKPEWGTKRVCLSCGARFYDMHRSPIACPTCGAIFDAETVSRVRRTRGSPRAVLVPDQVVPDAAVAEDEVAVPPDETEVDADDEAEAVDETEEAEEDEALIEDPSELGEDDEDMSEVIESGLDEDEDHR